MKKLYTIKKTQWRIIQGHTQTNQQIDEIKTKQFTTITV